MAILPPAGSMTITEPATLLTDYLMAALAVAFAVSLGRKRTRENHARWWRASFLFLGGGALAGGTYHGLHEALPAWAAESLWRMTVAAGSLCSFALMRAAAAQWLEGGRERLWSGLSALKLGIGLVAGLLRPVFAVVVADMALTMTFAAAAGALSRARDPRAFRLLAAGVGLFATGAAIQQAGLSPHASFNHNDLFHVVQMIGNACFFLSARGTGPRREVNPKAL